MASRPAVPVTQESGFSMTPQEIVLGLLGEYGTDGRPVWAGGLVLLLEDLGFSYGSARIALNRVVGRNLLERTRHGRLVFYSPTSRLTDLLEAGRLQTYYFLDTAEQSEAWTLVWYSIPERLRASQRRLARRLSFMGFGLAVDGLWILPRDRSDAVREVASDLAVSEFVEVFTLTSGETPKPHGPLLRTWDFDRIDGLYREFESRFGDVSATEFKCDGRDSFVIRTNLIESFRQLASVDPRLPDGMLKRPWRRDAAIDIFKDLNAALQPAAAAYFLQRTQPEPSNSDAATRR